MPPAPPVGIQQISNDVGVSARAAALSKRILEAGDSISTVCELVAAHFLDPDQVEIVIVALTVTAPDDPAGWRRLGDRVWLRDWIVPGSPCRSSPRGDGPEGAMTMPYVSHWARDGIVVVPDRDLLPPEGAQDRRELEQGGAAALVNSALQRDDTMFGSISLGRSSAGAWPQQLLADYRLLVATLAARLADQHVRRLLTDALMVGAQARRVQTQFFATVGHELRTPISAITGFTEELVDEAGSRAGDDFAEQVVRDGGVILRAADQLLAIVEDLLSTGRVLGQEDSRIDVPVAEAVADVLHWHRTTADRAGVSLSSTVDPRLVVLARPSGLRQVLTNLIGNAVVHNRPGGTVEVGAQPMVGEGGEHRVRVTVRDTGPGLTSEQLRRAFDPFVRFAGSEVRGTGLGLSLSRTVAERDGGEIAAESTPGQGSVFWVDLPVT